VASVTVELGIVMTNMISQHTIEPRLESLRQSIRDHSRIAYHGAILTAAETIVLRDGFRRMKMADVAEGAGVSVGTLYNYFENKESVLHAIMAQHFLRLAQHLAAPFENDDPSIQLSQLIVRAYSYIEQNPSPFHVYLEFELERDEHRANAAPNAILDRLLPRVEDLLGQCTDLGIIRHDIPLQELSWSLRALLHRLLLDWYQNPASCALGQRSEVIIRLFLQGARNVV
jgi:AcrR family transcriptional regulator